MHVARARPATNSNPRESVPRTASLAVNQWIKVGIGAWYNFGMVIKLENQYLIHMCEGCNQQHLIPMWGTNPWTFNNDFERPTLSPSVKHGIHKGKQGDPLKTCHYFIRNGMIEYCGDCWHDPKNKTLPLKEIE